MFLDRFDALMSKKLKKNILIHFQAKNTLKNNHYYNAKHYQIQLQSFAFPIFYVNAIYWNYIN